MARRRYEFDEGKIQKEGRGRGRGTSYKPWLTIQDVASHGRSHRIAGISNGRVHASFTTTQCSGELVL